MTPALLVAVISIGCWDGHGCLEVFRRPDLAACEASKPATVLDLIAHGRVVVRIECVEVGEGDYGLVTR